MDDATHTLHRRVWDAIPWVVNGTADAADRSMVAQHVASCADCRDELAFHRQLQGGLAQALPGLQIDPEPALTRMLARIDEDEAVATTPRHTGRHRSRWMLGLAAVVAAQAIALGTLAGMLWGRAEPHPADYRTLSRTPDHASHARIRLVPAPTLQLGELRALLERNGVQIAESSADGAILGLTLRPGQQTGVDDTVARLRQSPSVLLAEPIQTEPVRP